MASGLVTRWNIEMQQIFCLFRLGNLLRQQSKCPVSGARDAVRDFFTLFFMLFAFLNVWIILFNVSIGNWLKKVKIAMLRLYYIEKLLTNNPKGCCMDTNFSCILVKKMLFFRFIISNFKQSNVIHRRNSRKYFKHVNGLINFDSK